MPLSLLSPEFAVRLMQRRVFAAVSVLAGLSMTACGPALAPTPAPLPIPVVETAPPTLPTIAARYAIPGLVTDTRYRIEERTQLERDSAGRRETQQLSAHANLTLRIRRQASGSLSASGRIVGYQLTSALTPSPTPLDSLRFEAELDAQALRVALQPPLANECDRPESGALALVRDVLVRMPASVAVGETWSDSTVQLVCRAGVPMVMRTNATYTMTDSSRTADGVLVHVRRTSSTRIEGKTTSPWRALEVTGTGTATLEFRVAVQTGAVRHLEGSSTLTMTVTDRTSPTSMRTQSVVQRVTTRGDAIEH